ncbi:MAG: hypothetical protein LBM05_01275, partial [Endomicrobium sp.]|nr:hypothetical protein [Endomicrobium sp.]
MNINDFIKKLRRNVNTHKYHYGHTLVIAGSQTMPGAGILCCLGAMRSGIGLVTHAVRQNCLNQIYMMCHPEVLLCIYKTVEDVLSYIKNKHISSLVIGP